MMPDDGLTFFSPPAYPHDEERRQATVDSFRWDDAGRDPRLQAIVARAAALFGVPIALLSIVDRERQNWIVRIGAEGTGTARSISFCGHVVAAPGDVLAVPDAAKDERFVGNPLVNGVAGSLRFYAGAALMHEGAALGALCVGNIQPTTVNPVQEEELRCLAIEAAAILREYQTVRPGRP